MPSDKPASGQHSVHHGASKGPGERNCTLVLTAIPPPALVLLASTSAMVLTAIPPPALVLLAMCRPLVGALLLGERIGIQGMIAVACVVIAAIGITVTDGRKPT